MARAPRCRAGVLLAVLQLPVLAAALPLPPELTRWLAEHPAARLAPERDYGPFVYQRADGVIDGLSIDMLRLVQQRTGLKIQTLAAQPLQVQLEAARRGEADLLTSLRPTPERAAFLLFTRPYVSVPALLVRSGDAPEETPAEALGAFEGRTVAVGAGYAVEAPMRTRYPAVRWQAVSDDVVALRGVAERRFDAAVVDAASFAYVRREQRLKGLHAVGRVGFDYVLSFAVRRDWPQLRDLLDAGIADITPAERQQVLDYWMPTEADAPLPDQAPLATRLALALLVLAVLAAGAAWWRRRPGARR